MTRFHRPALWSLILLGIVLWVGSYVQRGLWEPDEARYAYVAREMHVNGDWFVMHLHGEPYPDKPPLMFWLMNAASIFTGGEINGLSARLPSLLGAILVLWATARLMERWRDGAAAWRAVAVLLTSFLFWTTGDWGQIDMLLCGLVMMSLWCFITATDPGRSGRFAGAYVFLGLAMLAKGPVALGIALALYIGVTLAAGEAGLLKRWHWAWGIPLACFFPLAWLGIAWLHGAPPEYFSAMLGQKSFGRVVADSGHARPFYYYLKSFPVDFLPWTVFLPAAFCALEPGPLRRRLVTWALLVIGLFSLSVGKRNIYILAAWPGAAMIVAAGWDGLGGLKPRWQKITGWTAMGLVIVTALVAAAAWLVLALGWTAPVARWFHQDPHDAIEFLAEHPTLPWRALPGVLLLLAVCPVLIRLFRRDGFSRRWFALFAGLVFTIWTLAGLLVIPTFNSLKAPIELAAEARTRLRPGQPIHVYKSQLAIVALYADRPGRYLRNEKEFKALLAGGDTGIVVFSQKDWDLLAPRYAGRVRARSFAMGSKELAWVDFPAP